MDQEGPGRSASSPGRSAPPPLAPREALLEDKLAGRCHADYRDQAWHQRTRAFCLAWDQARRHRLGLLATYFPSFQPLWDHPQWPDFNQARREADACQAHYGAWLGVQFERLLGGGFGPILPADLHGPAALRAYRQASQAGGQAEPPRPISFAQEAFDPKNPAHRRQALQLMSEIKDLARYICPDDAHHPADLLAEAVCRAALPLKALELDPELGPRAAKTVARRGPATPPVVPRLLI